jgi:hypothetical protein
MVHGDDAALRVAAKGGGGSVISADIDPGFR